MQFYYHKIGKGNFRALDFLEGRNPLGRPATVIFFRRTTIQDIKAGKSSEQAKDFFTSSLPKNRDQRLIVVIQSGQVWFLQPAGKLIEYQPPRKEDKRNLWKIMPVTIHAKLALADVPPVLAGISANAFLNRGTYRPIKALGSIKAICCAAKLPFPQEHWQEKNCSAVRLLECLSSVELETLVAKVFEAAGCFVPAYRGGNLPDVDLFAHNDVRRKIQIGDISIPPRGKVSIQVKSQVTSKHSPQSADYLIGLSVPNHDNCFGADWLLEQSRTYPEVKQWLKRSLAWLPERFVSKYDL
jgi:hypothetical protein